MQHFRIDGKKGFGIPTLIKQNTTFLATVLQLSVMWGSLSDAKLFFFLEKQMKQEIWFKRWTYRVCIFSRFMYSRYVLGRLSRGTLGTEIHTSSSAAPTPDLGMQATPIAPIFPFLVKNRMYLCLWFSLGKWMLSWECFPFWNRFSNERGTFPIRMAQKSSLQR